MNKIKIILLFSYLLFIALACQKECFPEKERFTYVPCDVKFGNTSSNSTILPTTEFDNIQFFYPVFNPNDPNEFIYIFENKSLEIRSLLKYNFTTKQKQTLDDSLGMYAFNEPFWSQLNFISYAKSILNSYDISIKIKPDGTIIPDNENQYGYNANWFVTEKEIVWYKGEYLLKKNINQKKIDTLITDLMSKISISSKGIGILNYSNLYHTDLKTASKISTADFTINTTFPTGTKPGLCWHPAGTKFYVSILKDYENSGIYEVEYPSFKARKIVQSCDKRIYKYLSCSPTGNYLLCEGIDRVPKLDNQGNFSGEIAGKSNIYLINIQTSEEIKLNL